MNASYAEALQHVSFCRSALLRLSTPCSAALLDENGRHLSQLLAAVDKYGRLAMAERIPARREKAMVKFQRLRDDYNSLYDHLQRKLEESRDAQLRAERVGVVNQPSDHMSYRRVTAFSDAINEATAVQMGDFHASTSSRLDDYILRGQLALGELQDQHSLLKGTQKRLLDAANTLGLSGRVVQYIEKRSKQDMILFWVGVLAILVIMFTTVFYMRS